MSDKKLPAVAVTSIIGNIGLVVVLIVGGKHVGEIPVINPKNIDTNYVMDYSPIRLPVMPVSTDRKVSIIAMLDDSVWAMCRFPAKESFDLRIKATPCKR